MRPNIKRRGGRGSYCTQQEPGMDARSWAPGRSLSLESHACTGDVVVDRCRQMWMPLTV
ncbi:hypothetical protein MAPG_00361 [Magnaporthiopsis poae ATCC 64411]|uniref:Uncharacterized protein n=1 Tax=Magnaporthiopsis poae (strain ATCC 64411 / 73-15) TaxID=644358 RepID=A0A0C4DKT1_MAGP6|nr:hypothetical protein MAPG_00361 [Magnaporthiopsis poae ATCC 64411]